MVGSACRMPNTEYGIPAPEYKMIQGLADATWRRDPCPVGASAAPRAPVVSRVPILLLRCLSCSHAYHVLQQKYGLVLPNSIHGLKR